MKKEILIILIVILLFSVSCSSNKAQKVEDVHYEQQEIERKIDKAFNELDQEIKKIKEEEERK